MFALLWIGSNTEGFFVSDWDIFLNKEQLEKRINQLIKEGFPEEDMRVFSADNYVVPHNGKVIV